MAEQKNVNPKVKHVQNQVYREQDASRSVSSKQKVKSISILRLIKDLLGKSDI